jgi:cyclopropane fatty-acyl-phospholipid synthase-like methyltransferase
MPTAPPSPPDYLANASASYYQKLHDENPAFQNNNWLAEEFDALRRIGGKRVLEIGCGNGRFLDMAAPHWEVVVGIDWAKSPLIDPILARRVNVRFEQLNAVTDDIPGCFDIVASADFLEHLAIADLPGTMNKLLRHGRVNFHKIACYDDGHSHLSILPPTEWLRLWHATPGGDTMQLAKTTFRKGKADRVVIVLTNAPELVGTSG